MPLVLVVGMTFIVLFFARLVIPNREKASLVISCFLLLFFSYGYSHNAIDKFWQNRFPNFSSDILLVMLYGFFFIFSTCFFVRLRKNLEIFTGLFYNIGIVLLIISFFNIGTYVLKTGGRKLLSRNTLEMSADSVIKDKMGYQPDIYYIVLDRYPSNTTLKNVYDFDNSEFTDYLTEKGFYVATESRCNYPSTALSLASSLNMEYINYMLEQGGKELFKKNIHNALQDYKVWRFLKKQGYQFIHFGSWYYPTIRNKHADKNINRFFFTEFLVILYKSTILYPFVESLDIGLNREQWKRVVYKFNQLSEIPDIKEPTFVFAHFLVPHEPFVVDQMGNYLKKRERVRRGLQTNYLNQLIYTNNKLKEFVNKVLSNSTSPAIIILQSDEGPRPLTNFVSQGEKIDLDAKLGILNAYYLPEQDYSAFYPTISPINSFPLIFNNYFNTELSLTPDKSYIYNGENFTNVTSYDGDFLDYSVTQEK